MKTIGNIKRILKLEELNQADLAKKCNISTSVISEFLNGKYKKPSNELLGKIASALGTTVSELTGEEIKERSNDKWTLIIEKAKDHDISLEKLDKLIDFLIDDK